MLQLVFNNEMILRITVVIILMFTSGKNTDKLKMAFVNRMLTNKGVTLYLTRVITPVIFSKIL